MRIQAFVVLILGAVALWSAGAAHAQGTDRSPNAGFDLPRQYSFQLTWRGSSDYPVIDGATNLPEGVTIMMMVQRAMLPDAESRIARGLVGCVGGSCDPAIPRDGEGEDQFMIPAVIRLGRFSVGPLSLGRAPFYPGTYPIFVFVPVGRLPDRTDVKEVAARWAASLTQPAYRANLTVP